MDIQSLVEITVIPKSSRSEIVIDAAGAFRVYLNSPPVDNRANEECIRLFAKALNVPKSRVSIEMGGKSRKKKLLVSGMSPDEIKKTITAETTSRR